MTIKELILKALALFCLMAGTGAGVHTICTGGTVQDFGLCLFIGAACAAWFQSE